MRGIWLENLKKFATGTTTGSKHGVDVNIANSSVPVVTTSATFKERRFMDAADTSINASAGAFKQVGDTNFPAANIANTITEFRIRNHAGAPLVFSKGADATAAALAANEIGCCHEGGEENFGVSLASGDKVWVRAMKNAAVTTGEIFLAFLG